MAMHKDSIEEMPDNFPANRVAADAVVIGAGVVGLAVGRELLQTRESVVVLEREAVIGHHASSRNSEVLHAGFYYEPSSLKARHCIQGARLFRELARNRSIPIVELGKLVVARDLNDMERLEHLLERGRRNGCEGLELLSQEALRRLEPDVTGVGALHSPHTAILDSHRFMEVLLHDFQSDGGILALKTGVTRGVLEEDLMVISTEGCEKVVIQTPLVVNAAGARAPHVSLNLGVDAREVPRARLVKGQYFTWQGSHGLQHLVYPLPDRDGLGIHATLDLSGQLRFGPDTQDVHDMNYQVAEKDSRRFVEAVQHYWPGIVQDRLLPAHAGIRSKVTGWGTDDFHICDHRRKKAGVLALYGIESPGLTAALSLAQEVARISGT